MDFTTALKAGLVARQGTSGRMLMILDTGIATYVSVRLRMPGTDEEIGQAKKGFKARLTGVQAFTAVEFTSPVDTTIRYVISDNDIDFDFTDGSVVKAEIQGLPLPVTNDRGAPGNPLYAVGMTLDDAPATAIVDNAPVAVGAAAVVIAAANVNRGEVRVCNLGPDQIAVGSAGITFAKRVVVLEPGDIWVEDRAANLALYAITDAGKAASVTIQEVNR